MIRSEIHSCGINSITSTISFCIGSMKTFVISSTVRCCTRLCGMIFTVSVTCGTKNRSCQRYAPELTLSEPTESLPQFRLWHVALKCSQSDSRHVPGLVPEKNHMTYLGDESLDLRSGRIHNLFAPERFSSDTTGVVPVANNFTSTWHLIGLDRQHCHVVVELLRRTGDGISVNRQWPLVRTRDQLFHLDGIQLDIEIDDVSSRCRSTRYWNGWIDPEPPSYFAGVYSTNFLWMFTSKVRLNGPVDCPPHSRQSKRFPSTSSSHWKSHDSRTPPGILRTAERSVKNAALWLFNHNFGIVTRSYFRS